MNNETSKLAGPRGSLNHQFAIDTPAALARLVASIPDEKLNRAPAPGKWSLAAIVAHLAEAEIALSWRYRQVEKEGAPPAG